MPALTAELGVPYYERIDVPATPKQKNALKALGPEQLDLRQLAGEPVSAIRTRAPGNDQPFGGIKVESEAGWFAARPSGTEDVYKIYAESFRDQDHLEDNSAGRPARHREGFLISRCSGWGYGKSPTAHRATGRMLRQAAPSCTSSEHS